MQTYSILAQIDDSVICHDFKAESLRAVFEYAERRFAPWGSSVRFVSITKIGEEKEAEK